VDSTQVQGRLNLDTLRSEVDAGRIDTVLLAMTDMQGRLQGKRLTATHFLDEVVEHDAEGCNYLLAVDVDMNTVEGYAMSSWERGYGDFVFKPDMDTLRLIPWQEGTALVTCDLAWEDGSPVVASPRQILKRQLERLSERGLEAWVGTELEFLVFMDTYEEAWRKGYRDLEPANYYNVDYSLLGTARIEPLLRRIRNSMAAAGLAVENAKGECNFGQHEINFKFDRALATADGHAIYKNGAKEIAAQEGRSISFMPKFDEREGNSCHIHLSLRSEDGTPVFAEGHDFSDLPRGAACVSTRVHAVLGPEHQLVQAVCGWLVRPDGGRVGQGQPHVLDAGCRARSFLEGREPRGRRGRQPVPRYRGHDRRRTARHRQRTAPGR
jgi:glutamine synthetase